MFERCHHLSVKQPSIIKDNYNMNSDVGIERVVYLIVLNMQLMKY